jgi:helicase MOV-10
MLRLNAWSRSPEDVPDAVRPYTTRPDLRGAGGDGGSARRTFRPDLRGDSGFDAPSEDDLGRKAVVVATCSMAAMLHNLGGGTLHTAPMRGAFDFIVIDEAGHAWEPETTACVSALMPDATDTSGSGAAEPPIVAALTNAFSKLMRRAGADGTQLVMAGDPKQLGPIVRSPLAQQYGLGVSALERLMDRPVYAKRPGEFPAGGGYDCRLLSKLVRNYRSHPAILRLPNRMFYDDELVPCARALVGGNLERWEHLVTAGFPLIFHGVEGRDQREESSPSWFNAEECEVVKDYVDRLTQQTRMNRVAPSQIGIITPYNRWAHPLPVLPHTLPLASFISFHFIIFSFSLFPPAHPYLPAPPLSSHGTRRATGKCRSCA